MVARVQLAVGVLIMLAGIAWGVLGPVIGQHFGYYGWSDGVPTYYQGHVCGWCKW